MDMQAELRGSVPKLPYAYSKTLINRAWRAIRERNLWSFLLFDGQWIAPPQYVGSSATVSQGTNTVVLGTADAANLATLLPTQPFSLITQRQFRIASSGLYNIWGYAVNTPSAGLTTLTLDRWWGEGSTPGSLGVGGSAFQIYQCYYVANTRNVPIADWKSWISIRDMANFRSLYTERYTRRDLDMRDPQRTWYGIPTDVVPFDTDQNPASASYGDLLHELWGAPTYNVNYQLYGIRSGTDLVNPTDTLPFAVGQDCVVALARVYAYEWAEANKGTSPRNVGPDFKYLMGAAKAEYESLLGIYRRADRERVDNWYTSYRIDDGSSLWAFYNTLGGTANPGGLP
jgi:hypothetical protein